jgi:hypothetical protein
LATLLLVLAVSLGIVAFSHYRQRRRFERIRWGTYDEHRGRLDIDRCFKLLVDHYGADTFLAPELRVFTPLASAQVLTEALALAASRFQITIPATTDIAFASPGEIGHVGGRAYPGQDGWVVAIDGNEGTARKAVSGDGIWRIRVASSLKHRPAALAVVVAHELAHCVLYRDNLPGGDEHVTDAFVILAGYGPMVLRDCPGYLHPRAVKYLMTLRQTLAAS